MYFLIDDDDLLKIYNFTWDKVSAEIKQEFDSKPVYNKWFLKTKVKSYGDEATYFHNKEFLKVGCTHKCLALITIDTAIKKNENIEKKLIRHILII